MRLLFCKLLGLSLMDWAAADERGNAGALKAHQDISDPEKKDNRDILIVTQAFGVISN